MLLIVFWRAWYCRRTDSIRSRELHLLSNIKVQTVLLYVIWVMVQFVKGAFHEALNMANDMETGSFIIENNNYAMGTSVERRQVMYRLV